MPSEAPGESDLGPEAAATAGLSPAELFSLEGSAAIVTGASGGLGRVIAAGLGAAGAAVLLTGQNEAELRRVEADLARAGVAVRSLAVDLEDERAATATVETALDAFGRLDVLVNNAGINRRLPILDASREDFDAVIGVDLRAPYFLAQAAARSMIATGTGGAIINISSINALHGLERVSLYGAAKAALSQLTRVMAVEWARHGIRANAVAPGFIETPLTAPLWADADMRRWLRNRVPADRLGQPTEIVGLCLLLASEAGSFITGQTFVADGGFLAGGRWFTPDA